MRALVTGASGHIGANIVRELLEKGHEVVGLVRRTSDLRGVEGLPVELVHGDVLDPASLDPAMRGVEVVFHTAANFSVWSKRPDEVLRPSIEGTRNVFAAAARAGARRVVHTSSCAAVGFSDRADAPPRTERDWRDATHLDYYRAKIDGERAAQEAAAEHGVEVVVLCPTLVLGPLDYRVTPSMRPVLDMANGTGPTLEGGANVVGVRDVARAQLLAAERGRPGERYLVGGDNLTLRRIGELVAASTGRTPKHVTAPRWVFLAMSAMAELGAAVTGRPPQLTRAAVRDVVGTWAWFDCTKAKDELGFEAEPADRVVREALEWFLEQGWLAPAVAEAVRGATAARAA